MRSCIILLALLAAVASAQTYTNPVTPDNTPDPGVIYDSSGKQFLAATTGGSDNNYFPIHASSDLVSWKLHSYIFPSTTGPPSWTDGNAGYFWAPELHKLPNGKFAAVFAARRKGVVSSEHSIGIAHADTLEGPWKDLGAPILTHPFPIGVIDATLFVEEESGRVFLVYKVDANAIGLLTTIEAVELDPAASKVISDKPWQLIHTTEAWEGPLVEAPWIVNRNGTLYLFYSGSINDNYAVGVAKAPSITSSNWTKLGPPIVAANNATGWDLVGPGHCSVLKLPAPLQGHDDDTWFMWLHTWTGHQPHYNFNEPRMLTQMPILWDEATGWPYVQGGRPPLGPQPVPPF